MSPRPNRRHYRESGKVVGAGLKPALTSGFRLSQTRTIYELKRC